MDMEKGNFHSVLEGMQLGYSHYGKKYIGFSKFKNRSTTQSSNSTPGYFFKKVKNTNLKKDFCTSVFIAELFIIAKIWDVVAT